MPGLAPLVGSSTAVVSIMAGRTLRFLEEALPPSAVIRAMPNTPAAIGRGITIAVANARVSAEQRELVHALLSAVGTVEWIADEALMDAVARSRVGTRLCVPARRSDGAGRRRGRAACARGVLHAPPSRARVSCSIAHRSTPRHCGRT